MQLIPTLLPDRGVLRISGADARIFLQGLVTNDVAVAAPDRLIYAALLTPQGKFLHDMFIWAETPATGALWLDVEAARRADLLARLQRYKLRAALTIEDMTETHGVGLQLAGTPIDPRLTQLGMRVIRPYAQLPPVVPEALKTYDRLRILLGVPDGGRDMPPEEAILLENNLEQLNAISWTKGCYVGQELTARTFYRALIKKRLFPVRINGAPSPSFGAVITDDAGRDVGVMRSSQDDVGLALLALDVVRAGGVCRVGDAELIPTPLSWLRY